MPETDTIQQPDSLLPFYQWPSYTQDTVDTGTGVLFDSIFRPCNADSLVVRPSLFTGHSLAPQHDSLANRPQTAAPAWLFAVVVLLCTLLCLYCRGRKIKFGELMKSTVDVRAAERLLRNLTQGRISTLMPVSPILCAALAMVVWNMTTMHDTGFTGYMLLTLGLTAAYLLRNGLLRLLATIFDQQATMTIYIGGNYLFHLVLAGITVPLLFAVVYIHAAATVAAWCIGLMAALVFVMRFIRGVQLFLTNTKNFSLFLFYYLCTIEMTPLLVLLKWFISQ